MRLMRYTRWDNEHIAPTRLHRHPAIFITTANGTLIKVVSRVGDAEPDRCALAGYHGHALVRAGMVVRGLRGSVAGYPLALPAVLCEEVECCFCYG